VSYPSSPVPFMQPHAHGVVLVNFHLQPMLAKTDILHMKSNRTAP
jgi:hypothetical protein